MGGEPRYVENARGKKRVVNHSVVLAYISGGAGSPTFRGALLFSDFPPTDLKKN